MTNTTKFAVTLDPLHIGAGGYRLGRVDNTIIRDAGNNLPKVPGSSLAGVARSYYAQIIKSEGGEAAKLTKTCLSYSEDLKCNCGKCPVCLTFGYSASKKQLRSHIGLLHFYDGIIAAFPVNTILGPAWITSPSVLAKILPAEQKINIPDELEKNDLLYTDKLIKGANRINVGWLYLEVKYEKDILQPLRDALGEDVASHFARFILAPDWLFTELVNSNLEVRTSVNIDPETGAAKDGALFTYEAIPSATLLAFNIEIDQDRCQDVIDANNKKQPLDPAEIKQRLDKALEVVATLGMGGMTTRGFGRVKFLGGN